jgi:hypothetical protein
VKCFRKLKKLSVLKTARQNCRFRNAGVAVISIFAIPMNTLYNKNRLFNPDRFSKPVRIKKNKT